MITIFFHLSLLLLFLDPGSEIWDPGSVMGKNQDPGSGINIPDPPHWRGIMVTSSFIVIFTFQLGNRVVVVRG
jgi:hypothetical protein